MDSIDISCFDHGADFEGGIGTIRSELIYRSAQSATRWLSLTEAPDYPYYRIERDQIQHLLHDHSLSDLGQFRNAVCIGPADCEKEIIIGRSIRQKDYRIGFVLIDSSPALLEHALSKLSKLGEFDARGVLLDVRDIGKLKQAMKNNLHSHDERLLFTAFGNIIGNYQELKLVDNMHNVMRKEDRLIFGAHLRSRQKDSASYPAYQSPAYYDHMISVLRETGVDPSRGRLSTTFRVSHDGRTDIIEIFFELDRETAISDVSNFDDSLPKQMIKRICVDVSCKFSLDFLLSELSKRQWDNINYWISECKRNVIFCCKR